MPIIFGLLTKYWPEIFLGLAVVFILGYIGVIKHERDSARDRVHVLETRLSDIQRKNEVLEQNNKEITAKFAASLKTYNDLVNVNADNIDKRIKSDKELYNLKLSVDTVRLFNASVKGSTQGSGTSPAQQGNDGKAGGTEAPSDPTLTNLTGQDLFITINENNKNHLKCVSQVLAWQDFWNDYVSNVRLVGNAVD